MERNYGVLISNTAFHGQGALTYRSTAKLEPGSLVVVPLKDRQSLGIVYSETDKAPAGLKDIIQALPHPELPQKSLALLDWMRDYYPAPLGTIVQLFAPFTPPKHLDGAYEESDLDPVDSMPPLTNDQKYAIRSIDSRPGLHILHGETGTGKTRVYIELAKKSLHSKKIGDFTVAGDRPHIPAGQRF